MTIEMHTILEQDKSYYLKEHLRTVSTLIKAQELKLRPTP